MQNRYFIDTNILIDLLVKSEYKIRQAQQDTVAKTKEFILNLLQNDKNICVINSNSIITAFFALTNKNKNFMGVVANSLLELYDNNEAFLIVKESDKTNIKALKYAKANNADYEDALQYFCAKEYNCKAIITNDKDFPKLDIALIRTDPKQTNYEPQ